MDIRPHESPFPVGGILACSGALVTAVSLVLPWESVSVGRFLGIDLPSITTNGFHGLGLIIAIGALAAVTLGVLTIVFRTGVRAPLGIAALSTGGLMGILTVVRMVLTSADVEFGVYVALLGEVAVCAGGALSLAEGRRIGGTPQPAWAPPPPPPEEAR